MKQSRLVIEMDELKQGDLAVIESGLACARVPPM